MKIQSTTVVVDSSKSEIITFLSNAENLWLILPQEKITDFKANQSECSFKVQGGIIISLAENGHDSNNLFLKSGEKTPFPFTLTVFLEEQNGKTQGYLLFDGEVKPFLKLLVEKPLTALFNYMSEKLKAHFEQ